MKRAIAKNDIVILKVERSQIGETQAENHNCWGLRRANPVPPPNRIKWCTYYYYRFSEARNSTL